jgi:hypothetical protein
MFIFFNRFFNDHEDNFFRREFRKKRFFLLEFDFKFISILHRVNN